MLPSLNLPKSSRISQSFERGWLSPRCLIFRSGGNHQALSPLWLCCFEAARGELIWPKGAPLQPKGGDACPAVHRLLPWGSPWLKGRFLRPHWWLRPAPGCSFQRLSLCVKASTSLLLGTRSVKGKSPGPLKQHQHWTVGRTNAYFKIYFYFKLLIGYFWHSEGVLFTGLIRENWVSHLLHMTMIHLWNCVLKRTLH